MNRVLLIYNWLLAPIPGTRVMQFKIWWLRKCGIEFGENTILEPCVRFEIANSSIKIGGNSRIASGALFRMEDASVEMGHNVVVRNCALIHIVGNSATIGNNVCLAENVVLESIRSDVNGGRLEIGSDVDVMQFTFLSANGDSKVSIGDHCKLAHNVSVKATHHAISPNEDCIGGKSLFDGIEIKKGCWICAGATIIPGVVVGSKNVVAAGSVVIKDTPDNALVAGVPAIVKKFYC